MQKSNKGVQFMVSYNVNENICKDMETIRKITTLLRNKKLKWVYTFTQTDSIRSREFFITIPSKLKSKEERKSIEREIAKLKSKEMESIE